MSSNTHFPNTASRMRRNRITLVCLIILAAMSWFCAMTPWVNDDYGFSHGQPGLQGLWAVQVQEYMIWSGKFIGHFTSRMLLRGPIWLHPLLTPLMFLALIFGGALLALGRSWRETLRAWHLALLAGLAWFALPAFGTVFFWRTGTPDYGYSLVWGTLFLVPWRFWADSADFRMPGGALFFFMGVLAGWSNENLGMLVILTALCVTAYRWRCSGRLPLWAAAGIAGAICGWAMMMGAPGNAARLAAVGGMEKIPLLSQAALVKFLLFWGTQQLEMLPYYLAALGIALLMLRQGRLRRGVWLPAFVCFLMAQASLAAFIASPSTPYRAMSTTFFFAALCPFSLFAAYNPQGAKAKAAFLLFCCLLAASVALEARVFLMAQPAIAARDKAMAADNVSVASFAYPETDKYFFPEYDIREIDFYADTWPAFVPWNEAATLKLHGAADIRAYVSCNSAMLSDLPQGKVYVAAAVHTPTVASLMQTMLRLLSGASHSGVISAAAADTRFACASADVMADGRAAVHIPGLKSVGNIAYIAVCASGNSPVWRAVAVQNP